MHIFIYIYIYLPNPCTWARHDTRSIFKWSKTDFNSEFFYSLTGCHNKIKEPSLLFYRAISERGTLGCILFPSEINLRQIQTVLSRIWIWITMSISYDNNYSAMSTLLPSWIFKPIFLIERYSCLLLILILSRMNFCPQSLSFKVSQGRTQMATCSSGLCMSLHS